MINLNVLEARDRFVQPVQTMNFDGEDLQTRVARRRARWTPAAVR